MNPQAALLHRPVALTTSDVMAVRKSISLRFGGLLDVFRRTLRFELERRDDGEHEGKK